MNRRLAQTILLLILSSCVSTLKISGDKGFEVNFNTNKMAYTGELLIVTDSSFIINTNDQLIELGHLKVSRVKIPHLRAPEKATIMSVFAILNILIANQILSTDGPKGLAIVFGLAAAGSIGSIFSPRENFRYPYFPKEIKKLQIYSRYPQGLNPTQLDRVLSSFGQSAFITDFQ